MSEAKTDEKKPETEKTEKCRKCDGTGAVRDGCPFVSKATKMCPRCGGTGAFRSARRMLGTERDCGVKWFVLIVVLLAGCASAPKLKPEPKVWPEEIRKEAHFRGYDQGYQDAKNGKPFDPYGRIVEP